MATSPPFHAAGSDTSAAAATAIRPIVSRLARDVYLTISTSPAGLTCSAIERVLLRSHQSVSARVYELRQAGCIRDTGLRRPTSSTARTSATVWEVIAPFERYQDWIKAKTRLRRAKRTEVEARVLAAARAYRDAATDASLRDRLIADLLHAAEAL